MDEQTTSTDGQLVMPESIAQPASAEQPTQAAATSEGTVNPAEGAQDSSLFENNFTPQDARQTLEVQSEVKEPPIITEENTPGKKTKSPIFWLVGGLGALAIIVLVIWLLAR